MYERVRVDMCVRVSVWEIDVCHKALPRMNLCSWKYKKQTNRFSSAAAGPSYKWMDHPEQPIKF